MVKKTEPRLISFDDLPKKYLSAPVADAYHEELLELYFRRRSKPEFENIKMNPSSEKFYRLYFYQGVSQADRTFLHQEYLDTQSRRYYCTSLVFVTTMCTYFLQNQHSRYTPFKAIRIASSVIVGYFTYKLYKNYSTYSLEKVTEPYYEKYAIR